MYGLASIEPRIRFDARNTTRRNTQTHLRVTIERRNDDPPEGLELDVVATLFEALSEFLSRSWVNGPEIVGDDGVRDGVLLAHGKGGRGWGGAMREEGVIVEW